MTSGISIAEVLQLRNTSHMLEVACLLKSIGLVSKRRRLLLFVLWFHILGPNLTENAAQSPYRLPPNFSAQSVPVARTNGLTVNTQNREEVRTFFNALFTAQIGIAPNWSGDLGNCNPGTTSAEYEDAVLTRINFYRAMAGVPADIIFNPEYSR